MNTQTADYEQKIFLVTPEAVEITERAYRPQQDNTIVRFKSSDGAEYYYEAKRVTSGCSPYNSVNFEVCCNIYPECEPNDDELYSLTDNDFLKFLNLNYIKSQWKPDTE